jgi:cytosine/adenosine deaminase-related metal-dependent hydrolase
MSIASLTIPTPIGTHTFETVPTGGAFFELREMVDGHVIAVHANHISRAETRRIVAKRARTIRATARKLRAL